MAVNNLETTTFTAAVIRDALLGAASTAALSHAPFRRLEPPEVSQDAPGREKTQTVQETQAKERLRARFEFLSPFLDRSQELGRNLSETVRTLFTDSFRRSPVQAEAASATPPLQTPIAVMQEKTNMTAPPAAADAGAHRAPSPQEAFPGSGRSLPPVLASTESDFSRQTPLPVNHENPPPRRQEPIVFPLPTGGREENVPAPRALHSPVSSPSSPHPVPSPPVETSSVPNRREGQVQENTQRRSASKSLETQQNEAPERNVSPETRTGNIPTVFSADEGPSPQESGKKKNDLTQDVPVFHVSLHGGQKQGERETLSPSVEQRLEGEKTVVGGRQNSPFSAMIRPTPRESVERSKEVFFSPRDVLGVQEDLTFQDFLSNSRSPAFMERAEPLRNSQVQQSQEPRRVLFDRPPEIPISPQEFSEGKTEVLKVNTSGEVRKESGGFESTALPRVSREDGPFLRPPDTRGNTRILEQTGMPKVQELVRGVFARREEQPQRLRAPSPVESRESSTAALPEEGRNVSRDLFAVPMKDREEGTRAVFPPEVVLPTDRQESFHMHAVTEASREESLEGDEKKEGIVISMAALLLREPEQPDQKDQVASIREPLRIEERPLQEVKNAVLRESKIDRAEKVITPPAALPSPFENLQEVSSAPARERAAVPRMEFLRSNEPTKRQGSDGSFDAFQPQGIPRLESPIRQPEEAFRRPLAAAFLKPQEREQENFRLFFERLEQAFGERILFEAKETLGVLPEESFSEQILFPIGVLQRRPAVLERPSEHFELSQGEHRPLQEPVAELVEIGDNRREERAAGVVSAILKRTQELREAQTVLVSFQPEPQELPEPVAFRVPGAQRAGVVPVFVLNLINIVL